MARPRDSQRTEVYLWEAHIERQIPRLATKVDDLLRVRRYCEATFREFGIDTDYPKVHFRSTLGRARKGGAIQGQYKPGERGLFFKLPISVATILHECVHAIDHRMAGTMRVDAHGPTFMGLLLRLYQIAVPDDWAIVYADALSRGLSIDHSLIRPQAIAARDEI